MKEGYRHELKYLISRSSAELLKLRLPHLMERDPHAGKTGEYTIRSLYFDDFVNSAYEDKISGVRDRIKYRIRYYNYDTKIIKLERKEKLGDLTRKRAQTITLADAGALERGDFAACPVHMEGLAAELLALQRVQGLRPRVLVDYDRMPFVCRDGNTRVTIDDRIRTSPYRAASTASHGAMIPVLPPELVVLEVKFDDFLPGYLDNSLSDIPKDRIAISKFAMCMDLI